MVPGIADAAAVGGYFSLPKILVMLILLAPWILTAPWVYRDAKHIRADQVTWGAGHAGAGGVGFVIWLAIPFYLLGLAFYVMIVGGTLGAYVLYRNARTDESDRILSAGFFQSLFGAKRPGQVDVVSRVKVYDNHHGIVPPPGAESPLAERLAHNNAHDLLYDLVFHRASEADMVPDGELARVRLIIDGVVTEHPPLDLATSEAVVQYLKAPAGMDPDEHRRPQQGSLSVELDGKPVDIMVTSAGTTGGQRMQFRIIQEAVRTNIAELGISEDVLDRVRVATATGKGLVIVSGRPRNGVTSTLYSLLRDQDAFIKQLVSMESQHLVDLENITQHEYGQDADLPQALASAIRRDPDVIMVDRCRDAETAGLIQQAAESKLLLLGLHATDSLSALARWIKVSGNAAKAVQNLGGVLCQVLVRKLCPECREAYRPDPQLLAKANIAQRGIERFYRKPTQPRVDQKGRPIVCQTCQDTGYFGRTGVFEFLELTDEIRRLVGAGGETRKIKAACRKNKMLSLQEQSLKKVIAGVTSIKEVIRVTQQKPSRKKR